MPTQSQTIIMPNTTYSCPTSGSIDGKILYIDSLSSPILYGNTDVYFISSNSMIKSGTMTTNGDYSTSVDLTCTPKGNIWQSIALTKQDEFHSVLGEEFVAEGNEKRLKLKGKSFSLLQFRIEDKSSSGSVYFNIIDCGDVNGLWHTFNNNQCIIQDIDGKDSLEIEPNDFIKANIIIKTSEKRTQFGEDGLNTYMIIDADTDQWQSPEINNNKIDTGREIMKDYDTKKYNDFEYVFDLGIIGDRDKKINFFIQTLDGIKPTQDPIVEFCSEGRYLSSRNIEKINIGCWTDSSPQSLVSTATRQSFKFDVK